MAHANSINVEGGSSLSREQRFGNVIISFTKRATD